MRIIGKFLLPITDSFYLNMPDGAKILTAQSQKEQAFLWAIIDTQKAYVQRKFHIFGTGNPFPEDDSNLIYIDTFQLISGSLVWHLFEEKSNS